jgi:hypothetical protein
MPLSINWDQLGQPRFDRVVESLVKRRYRADEVRAVNGRGGDGGLDIEILTADGRLIILQLKYFPEGFSGGFAKSRRPQIKDSFNTAQERQPDEWTLVVPTVLTDTESAFVSGLGGDASDGRGPKITVVDRDELDDWLADDPTLDKYFQRDPTTTLAEFARDFGQEKAALLGGTEDLASRISNLGGVTDTLDPDWTLDFARTGDGVQMAVRPQHPKAVETNPIRVSVELSSGLTEEQTAVVRDLHRALDYGASNAVRIPRTAVDKIDVSGPAFLAGARPPADIVLQRAPSGTPGVGKPLEIRIFGDDDAAVSSWVGRVTYAERGRLGGSIKAAFVDGKLEAEFFIPLVEPGENTEVGAGIAMSFTTADALPSAVRDVLRIFREVQTATKVELYIDGMHATTVGGVSPTAIDGYDQELLIIEQYADDLNEVQRRVGSYFNMPESAPAIDRILARVGRILLEGGIVAAPNAQVFNLVLSGTDTPELRESLCNTGQFIHLNRDHYTIEVDGRTLPIGPVYVVHPEAVTENAAEAIEALQAGNAEGFHLRIRPTTDRYFYLALADRPIEQHYDQPFYAWGLIGITQPDQQPTEPEPASEATDIQEADGAN